MTDPARRPHLLGRRALTALALALALLLTGGCTPAAPTTTSPGPGVPGSPTATTQFSVSGSAGDITVAGAVPDAQAKRATITALQDALGKGTKVTDQLNVAPGSSLPAAAQLAALGAALTKVESVNLNVSGTTALVAGSVSDAADSRAVADALAAAFPGVAVENTIAVVDVCEVKGAKVRELSKPPAVVFANSSAQVPAAAKAALADIAAIVKRCPGTKLTVVGQTDARGGEPGNEALGLKRANAVKAVLVASGVKAGDILAQGNASNAPVGSNDTEAGRAANRRVDIAVQ